MHARRSAAPLTKLLSLRPLMRVLTVALAIACSGTVGQSAVGAQSPPPAMPARADVTSGIPGFYQHPTLHGNTLVFAAEGDLWTVAATGGLARRLTSHPAEESHPVLSPDGQTVAFSARYEGTTDVYTMPVTGGLPTRRTWEGETSIATTWTPDGDLRVHHHEVQRHPQAADGAPEARRPHAHPDSARRRQRGHVRRERQHALLRAPGRSQQRHQALHRRHGAPRVALRERRRRSDTRHQRLARRVALAHVVRRTRVLRDRP